MKWLSAFFLSGAIGYFCAESRRARRWLETLALNWAGRASLCLAIVFSIFATCAFAQSPREQFQAAVDAYQKVASDSNAVKVIQLYNRLAPPPTVPEEARKPFVMGLTVFKESKDQADFAKAAELFGKAIQVAPWWSEARYNRAMVLEASDQFVSAISDLNVYLTFRFTESERRETQDKVYALEAKVEIARAKQAEEKAKAAADTPQAREAALLQKVEGARFVERNTPESMGLKPGTIAFDELFEIKGQTLYCTVTIYYINGGGGVYEHRQPGVFLVDRIPYRDGAFTRTMYNNSINVYRIRSDAQALIVKRGGYEYEIPRQ